MVQIKAVTEFEQIGKWVTQNETLIMQSVISVIGAIIILCLGTVLARILSVGIKRFLLRRGVDKTVAQFSATLLRYSLIVFSAVAALGRIGVETSSIIAVIGAAGLAIGLALQGSLANFAAGILLVSLRPFKAGEYTDMGGVAGTVEEVHIFSTTLRMPDNRQVIIPNSKIMSGDIINYSRQPNRRVDLVIGVAYDTDVKLVKRILQEVIIQTPGILHELGYTVRLNEMAASSLNYVVRVWAQNSDYWDVYYDLMESIKTTLDEYKIGIPFPQLDVHLHRIK
ncbi:small-conductance mechanosensitive channel MscS [Klebsiella sp. CN_Kp098]|uniref:small-conductance mechanosensitive channel MscS n=1 Tax=unclassified Klebsiella TaxID=2608929 RepID=UPI0032B3A2A2